MCLSRIKWIHTLLTAYSLAKWKLVEEIQINQDPDLWIQDPEKGQLKGTADEIYIYGI